MRGADDADLLQPLAFGPRFGGGIEVAVGLGEERFHRLEDAGREERLQLFFGQRQDERLPWSQPRH